MGWITYPFPNFNAATVEVWESINNFMKHIPAHAGIKAKPCYQQEPLIFQLPLSLIMSAQFVLKNLFITNVSILASKTPGVGELRTHLMRPNFQTIAIY